jgi:hypothetical protein
MFVMGILITERAPARQKVSLGALLGRFLGLAGKGPTWAEPPAPDEIKVVITNLLNSVSLLPLAIVTEATSLLGRNPQFPRCWK